MRFDEIINHWPENKNKVINTLKAKRSEIEYYDLKKIHKFFKYRDI